MNIILVFAIVTINLAFLFYTVGVWGEKIGRRLKQWHLVCFWIGFVFDTVGTSLMGRLAKGAAANPFHAVTGGLAIVLMLAHAIWASVVLYKKDEAQIANFHKFSLFVWIVWLVPFASGMVMGMVK